MANRNRGSMERNQGEQNQGTYERAMHSVEDAYRQTEGLVRDNPGSSALITFGLGLGLGLLLTSVLAKPRRSHWYDQYSEYLPDNLTRSISEAVSRVLPDVIAKRM